MLKLAIVDIEFIHECTMQYQNALEVLSKKHWTTKN